MKHFLEILGMLGEWLFEDVSARHEVKIITSPFTPKWFVVTLQGQILKQELSRDEARHWAIAKGYQIKN